MSPHVDASALASLASLLLFFALSLGGGALAFFIAYLFWIRRFARRVAGLQDTVVALAAALVPPSENDEKKGRVPVGVPPSPREKSRKADKAQKSEKTQKTVEPVRMHMEGRDIEIFSSEGGEEIRIAETPDRPLTARERDRIIDYLRCEGFLS